MQQPHWYLLTRYLKKIGYINNGLTIPYLYGAYNRLGYSLNTIEDLLNEILKTPAPFLPVIEKCDIIKHDVLQLETGKEVKKKGKDRSMVYSDQGNTLVISYNTNLGTSVKQVAIALSGLYLARIKAQDFSWNNNIKDWQQFTDFDKDCIDRIK